MVELEPEIIEEVRPRIVSVEEKEIGEKRIATRVIIQYGVFRLSFRSLCFEKRPNGKLGRLIQKPDIARMDGATICGPDDLWITEAHYWHIIDMARARFNEIRKARRRSHV